MEKLALVVAFALCVPPAFAAEDFDRQVVGFVQRYGS